MVPAVRSVEGAQNGISVALVIFWRTRAPITANLLGAAIGQ
jgi:hypothetical protein